MIGNHACPLCGRRDQLSIYSTEPAKEPGKTVVVYTCACGCVFSRQIDASDSEQDAGESAQ